MEESKIDEEAWKLVKPAVKYKDPQYSDGYDEADVYRAAKEGIERGYQMAIEQDKWKQLIEKLVTVRNSYTDEEWVDDKIKPEITADVMWAVHLMTKYEVNW